MGLIGGTMYSYLLFMAQCKPTINDTMNGYYDQHNVWLPTMDGYPLWMAQCTLLLLTQCMAIMNSTMYGYLPWTATHYVWHNVCYYCWHNVWLPQCPTLITLFEENQLVAISSNIKVHDSLQDHRKFISSLLLLFQLSVRSL